MAEAGAVVGTEGNKSVWALLASVWAVLGIIDSSVLKAFKR